MRATRVLAVLPSITSQDAIAGIASIASEAAMRDRLRYRTGWNYRPEVKEGGDTDDTKRQSGFET